MTVLQTLKQSGNSVLHISDCHQHHEQSVQRCRCTELSKKELKMHHSLMPWQDHCEICNNNKHIVALSNSEGVIPYLQSKHGVNGICNSMERLHTWKDSHLHLIKYRNTDRAN
jgi:hypothetical protein